MVLSITYNYDNLSSKSKIQKVTYNIEDQLKSARLHSNIK